MLKIVEIVFYLTVIHEVIAALEIGITEEDITVTEHRIFGFQ
tara:strand:- start:102 stop:227 length:126 start_codon:yes stop_codon:yes gene_type:complete